MVLRWPTFLVFAALASNIRAAEPASPAELFPASSLGYVELVKPADTIDLAAAIIKGTPLADALNFTHDRRDKMLRTSQAATISRAAGMSVVLSPEMMLEWKRIRGAAAAITGFHETTGVPQCALVILTGESNALGLLARNYLLTATNVRRIGRVEGIAVYQNRQPTGKAPSEDDDEKVAQASAVAEGHNEATYLYVPGLIVIGTCKAAVADVYLRYLGKEPGKPLTTNPAFRLQSDLRKQPSLYYYVRLAALETAYDAARKRSADRLISNEAFALARFLLVPKMMPTLGGQVQLTTDKISLTLTAEHDEPTASPALALLLGSRADPTRLAPGFSASTSGLTISLPARDDRAMALLAVGDALTKAAGNLGASPTVRVRELSRGGLVVEPILSTIAAITLSTPRVQELPKDVPQLPVLTLHFDDEPAAIKCAAALAKITASLNGQGSREPHVLQEPTTENVGNVKVFTLLWRAEGKADVPVHFTRQGAKLHLGLDRKCVAALATDVAVRIPVDPQPLDDSSMLGYALWNALAKDLLFPAVKPVPERQHWQRLQRFVRDNDADDGRFKAAGLVAQKGIVDALTALPPLSFRASVKQRIFRLELAVSNYQPKLPRLVESYLVWLEFARLMPNP